MGEMEKAAAAFIGAPPLHFLAAIQYYIYPGGKVGHYMVIFLSFLPETSVLTMKSGHGSAKLRQSHLINAIL